MCGVWWGKVVGKERGSGEVGKAAVPCSARVSPCIRYKARLKQGKQRHVFPDKGFDVGRAAAGWWCNVACAQWQNERDH